jgi:hypothetical protein
VGAGQGLSDDELFWAPSAGSWGIQSWGIHRRAACRTPAPFGDGDWVADFDTDLVMAAIRGQAVEPLTTVGWLMWHIGSVPGRLAQLDFLGGSTTADTGWTSPYLTDHRVFTSADRMTSGSSERRSRGGDIAELCARLRHVYWTGGGSGGRS